MRPACLGVLLLAALLQLPLAVAQTVIVYSRLDAPQAARAQRLARLYDQVLIDTDLAPGVPWRPALERGICASDRVLLLWSRRAAASAEVAREIQTARLCGVPVVPVLLDGTPLPSDVGQLQAVDWR